MSNNVAAYIRVSTATQTTENQLPAILSYCQSKGWPEPTIYSENESAYLAGHQRELSKLLHQIRTGQRHYEYLIILALDRLTRGPVGSVLQLINSFEQQGCKVVSVKESWLADAGPIRDLFTLIVGWSSNYESVRKSQNVRLGQARAIKEGRHIGRPLGKKDSKKRLKKRPVVFRHNDPRVNVVVE